MTGPRGASRPSRRHGEIARPVDADRAGARGHQQQNVHRLGIERIGEARQVGARPLDPERVRVAQEERLAADQRQSALDAAALVEKLRPLVGDEDLRRSASEPDAPRSDRRANAR